jgi:hypothetical protein
MDPAQVTRDADGAMRCRECGFRYALSREAVIDGTESGLRAVTDAVAATPESSRNRRPAPEVWSVNAYTAHLDEAAGVIFGRVQAIAERDRPALQWYDQDQTATEGRFDERPADASLRGLTETVGQFTDYLRALPAGAWSRPGVHSRAGAVTLAEIAHDMPHELQHHAGDVHRVAKLVGG